MKSVKIGIVGIGGIGSAHLNCIHSGKIPRTELRAVCDCDPPRLEYAKKVCPGIPAFEDYRELIRSGLIDSLLISVPHPKHAIIACDALENGLNVLVEKPVDISVSAAHRLNSVAKGSGKVFGIMFNQRTNPIYQRAREIVRSGKLGNIKRSIWIITNWYRTQSYYNSGGWRATWLGEGGGVLLNQAPHNLDLWQWICGMPIEITAFCGRGKWHDIEVEDDAEIFARYENGATGVFITSTGDLPGTNRLEISGSLGSVVVEQGKLIHRRLKTDERIICYESLESFPAAEYETEVFEPKDQGSSHAGILKNFADAILDGTPLLAPGYDGINELEISNAAYLSDSLGKAVKIPVDGKEFDRFLAEKQRGSKERAALEPKTHEAYSDRWQVRF